VRMPIARAADVLMRARPAHAQPGGAVTASSVPGRVQECGLEAMERSEGATSGSGATLTSRLPE
jgi:hypothetical protein